MRRAVAPRPGHIDQRLTVSALLCLSAEQKDTIVSAAAQAQLRFNERTNYCMNMDTASWRNQYLRTVFPDGIPRLWCPPITHYDEQGIIDAKRTAAHLRHLAPHVGGFLIPGSTGDGWELTPAERRRALEIGVEQAQALKVQVLIGALHPDAGRAVELVSQDLNWLKALTGTSDLTTALARAHVCGFTICPPRGRDLTQEEIHRGLESILRLRVPVAIYQLPQVTLNEMSPELTANLASKYQNFIFFKDTSGLDAVARSGKDLGGVFTVRGAEGDYSRWLKIAGAPYDGFLLSSANCFARQLRQMMSDISAGKLEPARKLSDRLSAAVAQIMRLVADLPHGNAFANSNKALDQFFAHGPHALEIPPPRLHAGTLLPAEVLRSTAKVLLEQELMPAAGYLD
jgi:dihydrodipicolinate synthase/N-acetylneuraminate lyase